MEINPLNITATYVPLKYGTFVEVPLLINPLPLLFKALLQEQKDSIFSAGI
jgi:hypothetical protein